MAYENDQFEKCETIRDLLIIRVEKHADTPLFVYWDKEHNSQTAVSFKVFEQQVIRLGDWFLKQGFHQKKIAIYGENSYNWILTYFAVVCTGNIAVLPDYHLPSEELKDMLLFSDCDAICFSSDYEDVAKELKDHMTIAFCEFADLHRIALNKDEPDGRCENFMHEPVSSGDLAVIAYTSGVTGNRKGVMLTHRNLLEDWSGFLHQTNISGRVLLLLPLFHLYGLATMMVGLMRDSTVYICESMRYMALDIVAVKPRIISAVPSMMPMLFQVFDMTDRNYRTAIFCGGAPTDHEWKRRLASVHVDLYYGYGMTECGPLIAANTELYDKPDGAMKVLKTNEVRIDDPDENGIGEILVQGPNVMRGYYKMPEETAAVLKDGWMHTGDLGRLDEDGFLIITGRKKNLLVLPNGENIAPEALEKKVMEINGVSECMAYLENGTLVMEIYAQSSEEKDIRDAVHLINKTVEASHRIGKVVFRDRPFEKNSIGKIMRK